METQEVLLENINRALPILEDVNTLYLQAEGIQQNVSEKQAANTNSIKKKSCWKCIIGTAGTWLVLDLLFSMVFRPIAVRLPFGSVLLVAYIIASIVACVYVWKTIKKRTPTEDKGFAAWVGQQEAELDRISARLYQITTGNMDILEKIPRDYRYYDAVLFFEHAIVNGQAESMKEAINLYEEHLHRQKMENFSMQTYQMQCRQSEMLAEIEDGTRRTARNTGISAAFSVMNFLDKC